MNANFENHSSDEQWTECEPGVLTNYATSVRPASSVSTLKITGLSLAVACGMVVIIFSSSLWTPKNEVEQAELPFKGGLTCSSVLESMPSYFDANLDAEMHMLTTKHLLDCPPCLAKFEQEAASRGVEVDVTLVSMNYSPIMDWPAPGELYSSLSVVARSASHLSAANL